MNENEWSRNRQRKRKIDIRRSIYKYRWWRVAMTIRVLNSSLATTLRGERASERKKEWTEKKQSQPNECAFTLAKRICIKIQRVCSLLWSSFSLLYLIRFSTRAPFFVMWPRRAHFYARCNILCACVMFVHYFGLFFSIHFGVMHKHVNRITSNDFHILSGKKNETMKNEKSRNRLVIFSSHFKLERLRILPLDQISFLMCVWNNNNNSTHTLYIYIFARFNCFHYTLLRFHYTIFYLRYNLGLNQKTLSHTHTHTSWSIMYT